MCLFVVAITIVTALMSRLKVLYCIYHVVLCILAKTKISVLPSLTRNDLRK